MSLNMAYSFKKKSKCFLISFLFFSFLIHANYSFSQDVTSTVSIPNNTECNNGAIDLSINGGFSPFQFFWSNGDDLEDIVNLEEGSYSVTIVDALCGEAILDFELECSCRVTDVLLSNPENLCNANSTSIDVISWSGTSQNAEFEWFYNDEPFSNDSEIFIDQGGTYCIQITDQNGCKMKDPKCVDILNYYSMVDFGDYGGTPCLPSIENNNQGYINLNINIPSNVNVNINWTGPNGYSSTDSDISGLAAGDYVVEIIFEDVNGNTCAIDESFTIVCCSFVNPHPQQDGLIEMLPPEIQLENLNSLSAEGECDGSISISAVAVPSGVWFSNQTFTFQWSKLDNPNFSSTNTTISNLCEGTYCVSINNGCKTATECFEILPCNDPKNLDFIVIESPCPVGLNGEVSTNGSIRVKSKDTNVASISWSTGETGIDAVGLGAGNYCVTVTLNSGCVVEKCFELSSTSECTEIIKSSVQSIQTIVVPGDNIITDPVTGAQIIGALVDIPILTCIETCVCNGIEVRKTELAPDCTFANLDGIACRSICGCPDGSLVSSPVVSNLLDASTRGEYWEIERTGQTLCSWSVDACPLDNVEFPIPTNETINARCLGSTPIGENGDCVFRMQCCKKVGNLLGGTIDLCGDVFTIISSCGDYCGDNSIIEGEKAKLRQANNDFVEIYPNPTNGSEVSIIINYDYNHKNNESPILELFDESNIKLETQELTKVNNSLQAKLNLEKYNSGFFYIRIKLDSHLVVKKLVKI